MRSLIFVLLATGTFAAPVSQDGQRPPECDRKYDRFHHAKDFTYNYEGETVSSIAGASSARSGLRIRARCVVKSVAPCQHVLKIDQVELWEAQSKNPGPLEFQLSQGSPAFAEELEAQDLVFSMDGGRITDILAHPEEPSRVLNIKRGILSALQVQFVDEHATLEEDDVVGKCKVRYEIKSRHLSRRPKVVYKMRNLTECTDRAKTDIGIHVHSYEEKPLSLLNSNSTCKLILTAKKRTQQVICKEEHIFRPFSAGYKNKSGAITRTRQKLELQSIQPSEKEPVFVEKFKSVPLKYAHAQPKSSQKAINDAFYLISRLSKDSRHSTKPDAAQHFSGLVFNIRKLDTPAMESLWQKVHIEEDQKMHEYFYDALPHCGTGGCAKVMSNAIRNNLVSHERGNMFLAGLAMAANPTKETVGYVLELCEENPGRTAMLTLGTLIHKVCESTPEECNDEDEENPITRAENFLLSRLNTRCKGNSPEDFENILITLKAIGNAGRPVAAEEVLLRCSLNPEVPVNTSIAALEAFRRLPCNKEMTDKILNIYGEYNLDVEIRIAAYLALMKCPSPEVFKRVAEILKNEVNNQVGSFVWSHMTNAMDSTEPVHGLPQAEIMKNALNGMKLREFNLNRLKFSRAWEGSFYSDILRFGGSAQSHLIYHPNSFFPRSAMVNVTVDVLGASINVLEAAARFEGFEVLIEQMFGDDGYYPDDRIMKMFNLKPHEERDKEEKNVKTLKLRKRSASIQEDINKVEKHLNKLHRYMDTRKHHPSGAVSVKMFGNEMRLASFDDISWLNDEVDKINMIDILIALAKGGKKSYSKSMMFLDAETTVPTILGLPLKLSAKGTTVAAIELAGKFDIRNMFWGKMSFDVRGYVKPSAVVDVTGRMGVSAFHAEAGILVNSSLYTVTQVKGNATYNQGEILKFEVGVPEEPVQFVNVSSSLFTTLNNERLAIEGTPRRIEPSPCLNMTRVLGITFCSQLSVPLGYRDYQSPFFPFSGPASFSISMQRTDPKLTKYQLIAERLQTEDDNKYDVIAKMSTPGAMWERKVEANGTLWIKKDGKLFSISTDAVGVNFGTFEATYNNITHAVNLTYSAKDAVYGYPIVLNGHLFNNTEMNKQELGVQLSASYKNYTIKQLTKLYNRSSVYGYVSNLTYWNGKYLYSSGELNVPQKSVSLLANHTCTKTEISFNGFLGDEEDNFIFSFSNEPTKAGIELTGRLFKTQNEGVLRLFARPCQQSFTLRGSYAKAGNEKGIRFTASHDNKNRVIRWYTGIVNSTDEKSFKANATVLGRKAEAIWTYFNFTRDKGIKFNGLLLNKSIDAAWSYVNIGQEKGLRFNATGLNKTVEAAWTFLNLTAGKGLKFNATAINKTIEAVWSFVSVGKEKGLRFDAVALNQTIQSTLTFRNFSDAKSIKLNATVLNKTLEAVWSYINAGKEKGLRFNATALNKTAEIMWSYFNFGSKKALRFNASALNKTVDATWAFINLDTEKSLEFKAIALNKTIDSTWTILNLENEKSLKFKASAGNKNINATWTFFNLENEKSLKFQANVLNKTINATWSVLNLPNEKSLKFNASACNKTIDAKWTFFNLENEKSIKFQARAVNKTLDASWTFLKLENENSLKFQASAVNKTVDATWSFLNFENEKSLKFKASAVNKTFNASWTFQSLENQKSLKFKASAVNKKIDATWSILNMANKKSLIFSASALNKTINATWTLLKVDKSLKFEASAANKTIEAAWTLLSLRNEKGLKFQARVLNRTAEATWTIFNFTTEKGLKLKAGALNNTIETTLSFLNFASDKSIKFNASALNKTVEMAWTFVNLTNEKLIKFNATGFNRSAEATWSYLNKKNERSIKFNVSAMNKTAEVVWSYVKSGNERAVKFNACTSNKSVEAVWSFLKNENGRSVKFNASAINKTIEAVWSYVRSGKERAIKFHGSAMNKTAEAVWSYLKNENERSIKFNASAMNKTVDASLSYVKNENEKAIKFHTCAVNKTVKAVWSYLKKENERSIKFKASAMNKTVDASLSYVKNENEKAIKFHACAFNKTVEAVWSYLKKENERSIKFNASAMNKTVDASWSYLKKGNEKAIKFHACVVNKTVEAFWSYVRKENERSIKFNASAMNRTVDASWSFVKRENEKAIKFHACAMNKTVEAVWSYIKRENERSIKFNASALNKTMEAVWTLFNQDAKKGLAFNLTVMNKTMNASLVYFRNQASMGLHLNVSCCNKSIDLLSKIVFQEKESKVIMRAAYQNYTVALIGLFQNSTSQKAACIYPEYLGRSHGKICAIFTNSSAEKSMALNLTVLNQTGELKTERFENPNYCARRLTAKFNKTIFFESWVSFFHSTELKSLHFNTTVVNKSASASLYFRNDTEKAIGFNATVLKKQVGVEGVWLNGKTIKEAAVLLFWNKTVLAKSSLMVLNNTHRKMLEYRAHIGRFVAEWQNALITHKTGVKELAMLRMLRNGSQSLFFDSSKLTYSKTDKSHELGYQYIVRTMGRTYEYGWDASYRNYSNAEDSYHEARFSAIYSKGKKVTLTGTYRNTSEELSNSLVLEYLPEKTVTQSLIWYKERKSVDVRVEIIPRKPITWTTSWDTSEGLSFKSVVSFLNKKITNWFSYSKSTGEYKGHFEICPAYPLTVSGILRRENGLHFTTEITALERTWNHKIAFNKDERKLQIAIDVMPNAPVVLDASWDNTEGIMIAMDLKGFKKYVRLVCEYDTLTKTFSSGLRILEQVLSFTTRLDTKTKTLFLTFSGFNRTAGFTGRFDWKTYVASTFVSYQNHEVGWFLRFNPASRSIVFNVTVTPRISGQVVGEMPDDYHFQVTLQRKFGENVVNETRLMYVLNAEASRVSLTWNTTTVTTLVNRVNLLKALIRNLTLRYYNLTVLKGKNLTKQVEVLVKKLEAKMKPIALKLYAQVKNYNYTGMLQNATIMAQNVTQRLFNVTIQVLNNTIAKLPKMMLNVTELYKAIRLNATAAYKRFRREVLPPIIGNVTLQLKNISRDLKVWATNVSKMASAVTVRGEKLSDIAKRVSQKVEVITAELVEKMKVKTHELIIKVREIEVRGQKLGPLYDRYMLEVKKFTCNFNATCTLKNVTIIAKNWTSCVRNITVLNKTLEEHFKLLNRTFQENFELINKTAWQNIHLLKKKACLMHQTAMNITKNLTRVLPKLMRNATVQAIYLVRNFTKEVRTIIMRVRKVTLVTYRRLLKTHRPLIKLAANVFISVKGKAYPTVLKVIKPISKFAADLKSNVTRYLKPIVKPLAPMASDIMYQLQNITINRVPFGHALDNAVVLSLKIASETLKSLNHTISSNISAVIAFIRENSHKTPDEIVDLAIVKSLELFNLAKKTLNTTIELGFNLSRQAPRVYNRSVVALNKTLQKLLNMSPKEIVEISIKKIQVIAKNVTAEVLKITKQLRALDLGRPLKEAWKEFDLKGKIDALELKAKWEQLVERIRAFNLKERALLVKYRIGNFTLKVLKEIRDITNLTQRILNLTSDLVQMNVSKEDFVKEFIAIGNETRRVFIKYGMLAKNTSFDLQRKLINASYEMAALYKNITVNKTIAAYNKTIEAYNFLKKYTLELYNEHEEQGLQVYNTYKNMLIKIFEEMKDKALKNVNIYREELTNKVNALIAKMRQYEHMTYEEIVIKAYEFSTKHGLALYKNVSRNAMELYTNVTLQVKTFYKNITLQAMKLYNNVTVHGMKLYNNVTVHGMKLYNNVTAYTMKLYKNVTLHAVKLYKNVTVLALNLYKNVTLRAVKLYNDTRNATMRAYNFTLVLVNRTKLMAVQYYNATRNLTLHYYNLSRQYSLQYYNLTRNLTLQYYQKLYNLSRNYTLHIYNVTRNITLGVYNKTRTLVLRGIRYINMTIVPLVKENYLKGKVLVLRYANKTVLFVKTNAQALKVWYQENKEKTVEELYFEAFELAERKYIEVREIAENKYRETRELVEKKIKEKIHDAKARLNIKVEEWKKELQKLNKTLMNITGEAISLYNQTANITSFVVKELAAIFRRYVTSMKNKTIVFLIRAKNISLPLLEKARNITLLKLNETRQLLNDSYVKFMARKDVKEFIQKHQLKERFAKAEKFVREKYQELVEYVKEMKPKVEANVREAIFYLNVTLPAKLNERYTLIKERYSLIEKTIQRIMANPKVFFERLSKQALTQIKIAIEDTPIEKIVYHEMWSELIEEVRKYELIEAGQGVVNQTSSKLRQAFEFASRRARVIVEKLRNKAELMAKNIKTKVQETRETLLEKFEDVKAMKLREIVEHEYVFKTIELAKNVTVQIRNITLQAKNLTHKFVAVGKVYYKNMTAKVENFTRILKAKLQNYTNILKAKVQNYTIIVKATIQNYTSLLNATMKNYTKILNETVQKYTKFVNATVQKYVKILKTTVQNYTKILNGTVQNYTKIFNATFQNYTKLVKLTVKNYTLIIRGHYNRIYESHIAPLYRNYTVLVKKYRAMAKHCINRCRNVTLRGIAIARNWTIEKVNLTRVFINKTLERGLKYCKEELERGMKYYREELKPLYYNKVLPYYKNIIVPMYRNYSKLLIALKNNVTKQALVLKERAFDLKVRAINMTRQAVQMTLNSKPYLMLRKFGKLTIRESILEGHMLYIHAYNFTLNMTRFALNVTLEKFNITKLHLTRALNTTLLALNTTLLESKSVISFLNATRVEAIETAVFITKYFGIEDAVKERVRRSFDYTMNVTRIAVKNVNSYGPKFLKESALKTLDFVNKTIGGYVNRTIGYLNVTFIKVTNRLNKTYHHVRIVISKKILDARIAFNKTIENVRIVVNKTVHNVRIAVNKTVHNVRIAVNKTVNNVRIAVNNTVHNARIAFNKTVHFVRNTANKTVHDLRAALNRTITKARISIHNARIVINKTITDFRIALPKYIQVTDKGITVVIPHPKLYYGSIKSLALASVDRMKNLKQDLLDKMTWLKEEAVEKMQTIKREAVIKMKTMKRDALEKMENFKLRALEKMKTLKLQALEKMKNLKLQAIEKMKDMKLQALEKMENLKLKILEKMEKLKREALELMKSLKQQAVVKMETLKQDAKEKFAEFKVKAKNMSVRVKTIGKAWVVVAMNKTVLYRQKTYGFVMKVYNLTKNHHLTGKYINITLHYLNITKDLAVFYRNQTYGFLMNAYNLTKNHPLTRKYVNTTLHYLNITKDLAIAYRQKTSRFLINFYNLTKQCPFLVRYSNMTVHYFNITKNFVKGLNMTKVKNVTDKYLSRALNLSRYCYNVTNRYASRALNLSRHYFNVTNRYVSRALNLSRHYYNVTNTHVLRALNLSRHCYNVTNRYLSRALNMSRHCYNVTNRYLSQALNLSRHWYGVCLNKTLNISVQVYRVAENVTLDIYNSSCLGEAMGKAKNYSKIAINLTMQLYRKGLSQCRNFSTIALNKTLRLYREALLKTRNYTSNLSRYCYNVTNRYLSRALNMSRHCYNVTNRYLSRALNLSRHWYGVCLNKTLNISVQVYRVAENVTLDIYNSSCLGEAMGKAKNYSKIAFNVTMQLYRKGLSQCRNFSTIALKKTLRLYREALLKTRNYTTIVMNKTLKLYREALLKTRNYTSIALNKTLVLYREALLKTRNYTRIALNKTLVLYREVLLKTRNLTSMAMNKTLTLYRCVYNKTILVVYNTTMMKKYLPMALNLSRQWCSVGFNVTRNFTVQAYKIAKNVTLDIYNSTCLLEAFGKSRNYSKVAFNVTLRLCRQLYNKTMLAVYNTKMMKKYLPIARQWCSIGFNVTRNFTLQAYKIAENVTLDIYNSSCLREALGKTRNYSKIVFNETLELCSKAFNLTRNYTTVALNKTIKLYRASLAHARNYSMIALNRTIQICQRLQNRTLRIIYNSTIVKKYVPMALNFSRQTIKMVYNTTMVKKYIPMAFNFSRQWCSTGFNATRNYTLQVYRVLVNVTLDICKSSSSLPQAWSKVSNYSRFVFNQTMKMCLKLYRQVYNVTSQRCAELRNFSLALYKQIREHEATVRYLAQARNYLEHSKRIMKTKVRNLHGAKRYLEKRVNHEVSRVSHLLNPLNWIPPFNSTAMIFGGPHVYTFDGTYYTFPGYKKPGCMYVLARDVRDNKFTILSQQNAIIVITEDSSVKIHQDGKVETIVKVTPSGKKISDGYHSELPVETFNTTIQREGAFIVLRHDLGLEIICDVEHYLCTFNIAKWYHGRMAGLLGTNNNEFHDEMIMSDNHPTTSLTKFVNSWEVTRDPECKIFKLEENKKPKCKETTYIQRCRALFKDKKSPLSRFYSVVNPEPFVKACELDYKDCDTSTPKDMKHCNTTAAYIELVRLQGVWAEYLPECGRCGSNHIGQRWFQKADKAVDVVIFVQETSILKSYAEKLPTFLAKITESLDPKFSFRFGVMGFGGRLVHERPHVITLDGQLMNDLDSLELAFEHLKFAGEESENESSNALEAIANAAYTYPFRPGATKIFLLLTSTDRNPLVDFSSLESISHMLETKDIVLNVIGKYRKFRGEVMGQNFRGNVFYRKKPEVGSGAAPLPEGEYMSLMKFTKGSVFGLPFLGSENKDKFGALQQASASAWREQIKRDQYTCKECFCARGDAGQGKTICKKNSFHKKC